MKKISNYEFINRIKQAHGNDIVILGEYINRRTKILVRHKLCGYKWEANPEPLFKGHGCPKCSGNIRSDTDTFKKRVFELVGNEYKVIGEYINNNTPIKIIHKKCSNIFLMAPKAFINGQRCPNSRYKRSSKSNSSKEDIVKKTVIDISNGEYKIIGKYEKSSKSVEFLHKKCKNIFLMPPTRFIKGGIRCPHCYKSKGEDVIEEWLKFNNFNFKKQYKLHGCKNKRLLPFDFAVFNKKNFLIYLIEYDGILHYKPKFGEKRFNELKINDNIKNDFCKNNNIKLIRIKYVRSDNYNIFKGKIIETLINYLSILNMTIPSQD